MTTSLPRVAAAVEETRMSLLWRIEMIRELMEAVVRAVQAAREEPEDDATDPDARKAAKDRTKDWLDDPEAKQPPEDATTDEVPDEPGEPLEGESE